MPSVLPPRCLRPRLPAVELRPSAAGKRWAAGGGSWVLGVDPIRNAAVAAGVLSGQSSRCSSLCARPPVRCSTDPPRDDLTVAAAIPPHPLPCCCCSCSRGTRARWQPPLQATPMPTALLTTPQASAIVSARRCWKRRRGGSAMPLWTFSLTGLSSMESTPLLQKSGPCWPQSAAAAAPAVPPSSSQ